MRVGVDARLLNHQLTGIGRYTLEQSRALLPLIPDMRFYVPSPLASETARLLLPGQVTSGRCTHRVARMLWSQTQLPLWAARDEVDVFWGPTHRLPRFLPRRIARVVTIHDLVWKYAGNTMRRSSRWVEKWLMPEAIKAADMILADSQSTADGIADTYPWASDKTRVVHLGMTPLPKAQPLSALEPLGIGGSYVLFVGTLEPRKNLNRLLNAYAQLPRELRQVHPLVIAGGKGWGGIELEALIRSLGLEGTVRVLGYVDDALLSTLYAHALFVAVPSLYEGFGLPIVEAMSFDKAVLVGGGSLPEVAGAAGQVVSPGDEASIRSGLLKLMDPEHRKLKESVAGQRARQFTWESAARDIVNVFEEARQRARKRA